MRTGIIVLFMNRMKHIRTNVFEVSQSRFARIVAVNQSTVCRWETGELEPDRFDLQNIKDYARVKNIPFSVEWFFV